MRKFADQRIEWQGQTYTVLANRIMPLLARIEGIITFKELHDFSQRQTVPQAKLAMAYCEVLRYCGVPVEEDEVYLSMFPSSEDPEGYAARVTNSIQGLMRLMLPPDQLVKSVGNVEAPVTSGALSRKRTRRR